MTFRPVKECSNEKPPSLKSKFPPHFGSWQLCSNAIVYCLYLLPCDKKHSWNDKAQSYFFLPLLFFRGEVDSRAGDVQAASLKKKYKPLPSAPPFPCVLLMIQLSTCQAERTALRRKSFWKAPELCREALRTATSQRCVSQHWRNTHINAPLLC